MRKILLTISMVALLIGTAQAANRFGDMYHEIKIVDETGVIVTDITNLFIYLPDTTTNAVIYSDKNRQNTITIPMTEASTNTTLVDGIATWWGPESYDFSMTNTDGVGPRTNAGHQARNSSEGTLVFPSYLQSISSTSYTDAQTITMGTGSDWVFQAGNVANQLSFTPAADNSSVIFGTSGTTLNTDFSIFVGTGIGFILDAGVPSLSWDGGAANINASSNFATNINTGTSTGAINIGNSAAGAIAVDSTSSYLLTADASVDIQTADASGDIDVDATAGSVIIDGGEAVADAVTIQAPAGGVDITAAATFDIDVTATGGKILMNATENAAGAISATVNGGVSETIVLTNTQGTGEDAFNIDATAGGIDIDFATAKNMAVTGGQFIFTSNEDVAGAFTVTANTGTSETIVLTNTQGTDEAAFNIDATVGGIDIDFATAKNMAVTGGQFIFTSNEDVASAFSVITNTGTSETITLVNTQGTGTGAITLTTTAAGDLDLNSGDDITIDAADDMTTTVVGDYTLAVTGTTTLPANQLRRVSVAIADTEMDNLAATPKELVAAVAGNTIEFVSAVFGLDWATTAWTEPSAPDDLVVRYTDGSGGIVSALLDATGFATATEDTYAYIGPTVSDAAGASVASVAVTEANSTNKALVLHNTGAEWTNSGDSQVVVIVYYRLHTTAELGL